MLGATFSQGRTPTGSSGSHGQHGPLMRNIVSSPNYVPSPQSSSSDSFDSFPSDDEIESTHIGMQAGREEDMWDSVNPSYQLGNSHDSHSMLFDSHRPRSGSKLSSTFASVGASSLSSSIPMPSHTTLLPSSGPSGAHSSASTLGSTSSRVVERRHDGSSGKSRSAGTSSSSSSSILSACCGDRCQCCGSNSVPGESVIFRDELKRSTRRSINACIAIVFLSNVGFSIVMPSIWPYMASFQRSGCYLGLAISAFSFGQTIGSAMLSLWYEKYRHHLRVILSLSILCMLIGDLWYALTAELGGLWMIFLARFLTGFGAGNQEVIQGFVASITTPEERPKHIAALSLFATLSFIIGPVLAAVISTMGCEWRATVFNSWTVPGFASALFGLVSLLLVTIIHRPRAPKGAVLDVDTDDDQWADTQGPRISKPATVALIVSYFFIFTTGSVYETVVVPYTQCAYHWDLLENSGLFALAGVFSALTFVLMVFIDSPVCMRFCRKIGYNQRTGQVSSRTDFFLILPTLLVLSGGYALMISGDVRPANLCIDGKTLNAPMWRFLLGSTLVTFTFPLSFSGVVNIFSRLLTGKSAGYITVRMRFLKAGGYLARMIAPLWSGCVFEYNGFDIVFLITMSGVLFAFLMLLSFSRYLIRTIDQIHAML